jgi:hypothetical protein
MTDSEITRWTCQRGPPYLVMKNGDAGDDMKEIAMYALHRISMVALSALVSGTATASAGQLPHYEVTGFLISPMQALVVNSSSIQEQPPALVLTTRSPIPPIRGEMPASSDQMTTSDRN